MKRNRKDPILSACGMRPRHSSDPDDALRIGAQGTDEEDQAAVDMTGAIPNAKSLIMCAGAMKLDDALGKPSVVRAFLRVRKQ